MLVNCYLLVGGDSRRMGRSKVELFRDAVVRAASPLFDEIVAVQRPGGAADPQLRTIFEEPHELRAPLFGIARALDDARGRAFILAIDYPFLTVEALRAIRDRESSAPLVVPCWDGVPQLLCGIYDASLAQRIRARIAAGRFDIHGLLEEASGAIIAEAELRAMLPGEPFRNVNTPQELEEGRRLHESRFLTSR